MVTPAEEFHKDLTTKAQKISDAMARSFDMSLFEERHTLHVAIESWAHFSKRSGWQPGDMLVDAYQRFSDAIRANMMAATPGSIEERTYGRILISAKVAMK